MQARPNDAPTLNGPTRSSVATQPTNLKNPPSQSGEDLRLHLYHFISSAARRVLVGKKVTPTVATVPHEESEEHKRHVKWNKDNLDLAVDQLQRRLDRQFSSRESITTRASVILGLATATLAGLFNLSSHSAPKTPDAFLIGVVLIVISIGFSIAPYLVANYRFPPEPDRLIKVLEIEKDELHRRLVDTLRNSCNQNDEKLGVGKLEINVSMCLLVAGVVVALWGALL